MTAPSTFVVTGTFLEPDGTTPAAGTVTFRPSVSRYINNGNVIVAEDTVVTLDGAGKINNTSGVTLIQAAGGYDVTTAFAGHQPRTFHIAATGAISISEARVTMTVTGKFYQPDNTTETGTVELTDAITGDLYVATLSSGSISQKVFKNGDVYNVVQKLTGQAVQSSYTIPGTADIDLATV